MDLRDLVTHYEQPDEARSVVEKSKITLLVGISGAGKDTTKHALLATDEFMDIVSYTTRPPRSNNGQREQDGIDYHFIDETKASEMLARHEFVEAKLVHGTLYGTTLAELITIQEAGKIAVTDIDVQGVREYKELSLAVVAIFILPPDYRTWRERLSKRYATQAEFDAEWPRRSASALVELEEALSLPYYHFIINDEIERTASVAGEIARRGDVFKRADDEARLAARDLLESIRSQT